MSKTIKVLNAVIPMHFYSATVIHADKFTDVKGGAFNIPVSSTLHTEMVFRLESSDEDYRFVTKDLDLPVYTNQQVTLISAGEQAVGFIDDKSNKHYYIINNIARKLGFGLHWFWIVIIGLICDAVLYFAREVGNLLYLSLAFFSYMGAF